MFSQYTTYLANHLCGGSSRKLIAGWWYSILGMTIAITLLSLTMISNNNNNNSNNNNGTNDSSANTHQCIIALWSSFLLCCFSIGGTMIMRKFHNSIAVGFFMGVTVTSCQFYIGLAFLYFHYRHYNIHNNDNNNNNTNGSSAKDVTLFAYLSLVQAILLGSFAIILAAHRTEISFDSTAEEHHLPISNNQDLYPPKAEANTNNNSNRNSEGMYQAPPRSNHHRRT